ncbi:plasmid mobilization relaxosome protein MobC [uncultured Clostridium sp.]|jgi:hypothetical protein|uniref:plasmid mobilization relaxosome protein MobC n=1 Tax=uncultured Clostridium sp. TaxID=59620 RepID=UPI002584642D|nr:plasmid mobilization relaxosome protein MobC [uncultured Clostridium sp.]
MSEVELKKCIDCNKEYPATTEYFYKNGTKLQVRCKKCHNLKRKINLKKEKENLSKSRIVLTEKQEKIFSKRAEEFCMSKTDFLKLMIVKAESEAFVKIDSKCFDNFNYQIMGIARNINQMAHVCNMTNSVSVIDIENLRKEFKKIREWQNELEQQFKMIDTSIKYTNEVLTFDDI